MPDRPPTSVLLPATRWTDACGEVTAQLTDDDELLVVHDDDGDPVAGRSALPDGVTLVAAGEPSGCSGKANAIAAGMEAAANDRLVWTDDDFHHPPDWLARLHPDYERLGPVTELPTFVGQDPLAVLLEPVYLLGGTLGTYLGDHAWGGAVMFERDDVAESAFLSDLRRTVSDDGLLGEHTTVAAVDRTRTVSIGGRLRRTLERHVRFTQIATTHDPVETRVAGLVLAVVLAACLAVPAMALAVTAAVALVAARFGVWRWTALLAVPALAASLPLGVYAAARRTFVWGGRRYRWREKFDVEVLG